MVLTAGSMVKVDCQVENECRTMVLPKILRFSSLREYDTTYIVTTDYGQ